MFEDLKRGIEAHRVELVLLAIVVVTVAVAAVAIKLQPEDSLEAITEVVEPAIAA